MKIEDKYKKLSQREHVLLRSGMYIGSVKKTTETMYIANEEMKMEKKIIEYSPGFIKIFDEILTNATDQVSVSNTKCIKVEYCKESGEISVWNDGNGIPVEIHSEHGIYVPELIFGHLLSGSNYDDTKERTGAGTFGIGGKVCNIYSKKFTVETIDFLEKKKFVQEYADNMSIIKSPKITKSQKQSYTKITFIPDYKRFEMEGLEDDAISLIKKRVIDCIAYIGDSVSIYLNGKQIKGKGLLEYIGYFFQEKQKIIYEKNNDVSLVWEYAVLPNNHFDFVSFVNGNSTIQGGKHVDYIMNQIISKFKKLLEEKKKIKDIKINFIRESIFLFLRATIVNPSFNSQTKEQLTTPVKDFGCNVSVSDAFILKLYKSSITDSIIEKCKSKDTRDLSKQTDGKKSNKVYIPKLEDAIWAGTSKSNECTLILTEGLSAMTFSMWGRSVLKNGVEKYGSFPLKGKILNIRDATVSQLINNEEINNLKKIIGLKQDKVYTDTKELRYGKIILLVDSDYDGSHIKGLLVNMFHHWWPSLLKLNFIQTLRTPIVVATKGKNRLEFFTEGDYRLWKEQENKNNWSIKYYKGLGTSRKEDAKDIFSRIEPLKIDYYYKDSKCDHAISLAFEKDKNEKVQGIKLTDQRKNWLKGYDKNIYIDSKTNRVSYQDLIHKELVHFSIYDNMRSIPNMIDGLKPSQRKIIHYMLQKCSTTKDIKVAQLSGYVSAETNYHHGEVSLQQAIINLAQDYIGTNNLNFLQPNGNMGSRYASGDSASPRYIYTKLMPYTPLVFDKRDFPLLSHIIDDGVQIEPEFFVPIIPTVLLNGISGIGTGYSCFIPPHNPKDIIDNIKRIISNKEPLEMTPYYRNFTGKIEKIENGKYQSKGIYERTSNTTIRVKELPIGMWITNYKDFLESIVETNSIKKTIKKPSIVLKDITNKTKDDASGICFEIEFKTKADLDKLIENDLLEKELKLIKQFSSNNMYLFDDNSVPVKFDTTNDILIEFCRIRMKYYSKRRLYLLKLLKDDLEILKSKMRFITEYMDDIIQINRKTKTEIINQLISRNYNKVDGTFEYLTKTPISSLSKERIDELNISINKKTLEYNTLKSKDEKILWLEDIKELEKIILN